MDLDFNSIGKTVLGIVITTTKDQVNEQVDKAAAALVAAVKSSETPLDDTIISDLVAPALERFASALRAGLATV